MQTLPGPVILFVSAWNTFKAHWKTLLAISMVPYLLLFIGQTFSSAGGVLLVTLGAIFTIVGCVISIAMQPAIISATQKLSVNPGAVLSLKEQYKFGFSYFWPVLGLSIINGVIVAGGALMFVIPALIMGVYTGLYTFSRILDNKKGLSSFTENYSLVKGRWWGTFGRIAFLLIGYVALSLIFLGLQFIVMRIFGISAHSLRDNILSAFFNMLSGGIMASFTLVYLHNLYISLKSTRTPDVQTVVFKKWLVFFLVVGVIMIVLIPLIGLSVAASIPKFNLQ